MPNQVDPSPRRTQVPANKTRKESPVPKKKEGKKEETLKSQREGFVTPRQVSIKNKSEEPPSLKKREKAKEEVSKPPRNGRSPPKAPKLERQPASARRTVNDLPNITLKRRTSGHNPFRLQK